MDWSNVKERASPSYKYIGLQGTYHCGQCSSLYHCRRWCRWKSPHLSATNKNLILIHKLVWFDFAFGEFSSCHNMKTLLSKHGTRQSNVSLVTVKHCRSSFASTSFVKQINLTNHVLTSIYPFQGLSAVIYSILQMLQWTVFVDLNCELYDLAWCNLFWLWWV